VVLGFRFGSLGASDRRMMAIDLTETERFFAGKLTFLIHPLSSRKKVLEVCRFLRAEYTPLKEMSDSAALNLSESNRKLAETEAVLKNTKQHLDAVIKWIVMTHELAAPLPQKTILSILQESRNAKIVKKI